MKFSILAAGLLPLVAAGGIGSSMHERAEAGFSPKLEVSMDEQARRAVEGMFERNVDAELGARMPAPQAPSGTPTSSATPASSSSVAASAEMAAACQSQLALLNGNPSNPSGKSACYSISQFNNQTGAFQAQVMIFDIGLPTGQWVDLLDKGEAVAATYPGGEVSGVQNLTLPITTSGSPAINASLLFTGILNSSALAQTANVDAMRAALTPKITIGAETSDGQFLNTTMSNQEGAFITGFFSSSSFTQAQFQAAEASGSTFVLPGTTFGIFPVGFIVTGVWSILFIAAFGYGTYGRYQFRMSYRRLAGRGPPPKISQARAAPGAAAYDIAR